MTGPVHPRLVVAIPKLDGTSESFIRGHIDGLFPDPTVIWGAPRPIHVIGGGSVLTGLAALAARFLPVARSRAAGAVGRRLPAAAWAATLGRFLSRRDADVVLGEYGPTAVEVMDGCAASRTPLVAHFHGFDAYTTEVVDDLRDRYGRLFEISERVVVVSEHMRARIEGLGCPPERIVCIPCGVDLEIFTGARPGAAPLLFLALGRFVEKKAPQLTLRAFAALHATIGAAKLVMLGDGELRQTCVELAKTLGVADHVELPGVVAHGEVVTWMRRARCFVQHSRRAPSGDCEGTPVSILEASSCGLPVVSTRHGGIVDAVVDGSSGFLVDEGDVAAMADRMRRLACEPTLAERMGAAGRRHVAEHYSMSRSHGRLRCVLREAAASAG